MALKKNASHAWYHQLMGHEGACDHIQRVAVHIDIHLVGSNSRCLLAGCDALVSIVNPGPSPETGFLRGLEMNARVCEAYCTLPISKHNLYNMLSGTYLLGLGIMKSIKAASFVTL